MNKFLLVPLIIIIGVVSTGQAFAANGTIKVSPGNGTYANSFTINMVIDGGGQSFNAAQAAIKLSQNLAVKDITLGNCNFSFIKTPSVDDLSFSGAILGGSVSNCTLYT